MIIEEIKNIKSEKNDLKSFGRIMGIALAIIGGVFLWQGKKGYFSLFVISHFFIVSSVFIPVILKPVHKAWMSMAVVLGWLMTRIILTGLFYAVITPIGIITRLCGKDFLSLKNKNDTMSYWIKRQTGETQKSQYEKQY